ncbi:MAG: LLM class flavin-dependent oxidoreductase [Caulobacteraceae bacterium]|nr:LLM class flavin-dependent oxidoreductase [Caulobacteraceae bacterium]
MRVVMMIEGQEGVTWPQWKALAEAAEQARLDGLFRSDHYTMIHGLEGGSLDAWTTLAALAPLTQTLRLGTLVSPVTFRHPSLMAHIVASVDHISGGRVELGLGTGWYELEHVRNGFAFPPMGERTRLLAEQVEIIVRSWTERDFDHAGEAFTLRGQQFSPGPLQSPRPPLILGGRAGPRSVALAARYASEYNAFAATPKEAGQARAVLDAACARAGRDPATLAQSTMVFVLLGEDEADAQARASRLLARLAPDAPLRKTLEQMRAGGLLGAPADVAERLAPFGERGVSRLFVQNFDFDDLGSVALTGLLARSLEAVQAKG